MGPGGQPGDDGGVQPQVAEGQAHFTHARFAVSPGLDVGIIHFDLFNGLRRHRRLRHGEHRESQRHDDQQRQHKIQTALHFHTPPFITSP